MIATNELFDQVAKETLSWPTSRKWDSKDKKSRIRAMFGASPDIIAGIWNRIWKKLSKREREELTEEGVQHKYLLYALVFLKVYSTEEVHCAIVDWPSTKCFRKWSWFFVNKIAELKNDVIKLVNRFGGYKEGDKVRTNCFISIDCTDCPIFEPWPFDKRWFSVKTHGPALKYEVAVCIRTGFIVWINGPFKASTKDPTLFEGGLSKELAVDECVEADGVYHIRADGVAARQLKRSDVGWDSAERKSKALARSRNERVNAKLKVFNVLTTYFRHMKPREAMMGKHKLCFTVIAVITQIKMEAGEKVEDWEYDDEYNMNYF